MAPMSKRPALKSAAIKARPSSTPKDKPPVVVVPEVEVPAKKGEEPLCTSHPIRDFCRYAALEKKYKGLKSLLQPHLVRAAVREVFSRNTANPGAPIVSVTLTDTEGEATAMASFKDSYPEVDPEVACEQLYDELGIQDINDYLEERVVGKFNNDMFVDKATGKFNKRLFKKVAAEEGVSSPLTLTRKAVVKANFHGRRWVEFPTAEDQEVLFQVIPNTVSITPKAPRKK